MQRSCVQAEGVEFTTQIILIVIVAIIIVAAGAFVLLSGDKEKVNTVKGVPTADDIADADKVIGEVTESDDMVASGALFDAMTSGKTAVIDVNDSSGKLKYSWTFTGKSDTVGKDVDLKITQASLTSSEKVLIRNANGDADNAIVLMFPMTNGVLPVGADIKYYVDEMKAGAKMTLQFVDENKLTEPQDVTVDNKGYITFKVTHNSDFVLYSNIYNITYTYELDQIGTGSKPLKSSVVDSFDTIFPEVELGDDVSFQNWNDKEDGSGTTYFAGNVVKADIQLFAQFKQPSSVTYTWSWYDKGSVGDSVTNKTAVVESFEDVVYDELPEGMSFREWNTAADGNGTKYAVNTPVDKDLILFAVLNGAYTVTYDGNGGAKLTGEEKYEVTGTTMFGPCEFERVNYTFTSYNTKSDGTGDKYLPYAAVPSNITVYAIWSEFVQTYEVTYIGNGGTTADGSTKYTEDTAYFGESLFTNGESSFSGWNTAADGSGTSYLIVDKVTQVCTVYAQWKVPGQHDAKSSMNAFIGQYRGVYGTFSLHGLSDESYAEARSADSDEEFCAVALTVMDYAEVDSSFEIQKT